MLTALQSGSSAKYTVKALTWPHIWFSVSRKQNLSIRSGTYFKPADTCTITFVEDNAAKIDEDKMGKVSFLMVITGGPYDTGATTAFWENHSRKSSKFSEFLIQPL